MLCNKKLLLSVKNTDDNKILSYGYCYFDN